MNPAYLLKPDNGRALLLSREYYRPNEGGEDEFSGFIHPVHAMVLSFFDGRRKDPIAEAADYLGIQKESVEHFITPLIENKSHQSSLFSSVVFVFPKRLLIYSEAPREVCYTPDEFVYDKIDLRNKRHLTPTDITFMVTNKCATDCIYCYADRREKMDCQVPLERLEAIIREARSFRARTFSVIGGEFLLYKHWRELLRLLFDNGFSPYLSTKVPVGEKVVRDLAELGVKDIQVSLDTLICDHLTGILNVKERYLDQIKHTLQLLSDYGIQVTVHTILTTRNQTLADMDSIYQFIRTLKTVRTWRLDPAGATMYLDRQVFEKIRPTKEAQWEIYHHYEGHDDSHIDPFSIQVQGISVDNPYKQENYEADEEEKKYKFMNRALCTGNFSQLFILPDGQVTMCEELYWHPQFIFGDIRYQSLQEIWNSEKALDLFCFPQYKIPSSSPCSSCNDYYSCREIKQVCWKNIVKAYGAGNWFFPDTNCPKAPAALYSIK